MAARELTEVERQELVAYLADEADGPTTERVEALLAGNPTAQLEKNRLVESWRLLDLLDRPKAAADFLSRTASLAMTQAPSEGARKATTPKPASRPFRHWWAPVAALGFVAGWIATSMAPNPHSRLLQDFPVLERFDELRATRTLGFLEQVRKLKLVGPAAEKGGTP